MATQHDRNDELAPLASLTPDPRNARRHTDRNIGLIVDALREVGTARSIVVDETGVVLAGNATVETAGNAGIDRVRIVEADGAELIAVRRSGLTPNQKRRLALLDNRTGELAEWDTEVLASLAEDTDLAGLWEPDELAGLLAAETPPVPLLGDPEDVPELPTDPVTQPGDLWMLGSHRLLCGDATKRADLDRLMAGERAACLWTDPPYGVGYVGGTKDALTIANDDAAGLEGLLRAALGNMNDVLVPGAAFYIAHPAGPLSLVFLQAVTELGWKLRQTLVWVKDRLVLGHSDYHYIHEPILYGVLPGGGRRGRGAVGWYGDDSQTSVFAIPRPSASPDHPTSKPVALVAAMLGNSTKRGDVVLDPFGGSGSTLIACEQLGRCCRLLELDPRYCDGVVTQWEGLTGQTAEREQVREPAA